MKRALLSVLMLGGLLGGCVTANVDEMTHLMLKMKLFGWDSFLL